jgi:predicted site-specific integrase-resolvase
MIDLENAECMSTTMMGEKAFRTKHLSKILGVSVATVQKYLRTGKIKTYPRHYMGHEYYVTESQLREYLGEKNE